MSLIEYHDPDDLFPLLLPSLLIRLPLKNLHWKSATRPLRSISSLQVDFTPDQETQALLEQRRNDSVTGPDALSNELLQNQSSDAAAARPSDGPLKTALKGRRHQIPGLRQTPYLKIYLLRCDDSEAYKASSRKLLRTWIQENVRDSETSSAKNKQENHDAFEWLILHVVLPDTPAAGQPRWSKQTSTDSADLKEKSSGSSKWPGRGSATILEKIRSDFNESGKHAHDRVAQIRLQKDAVPSAIQDAAPSAVGSAYSESPPESAKAWNDLISKFKALILMSFDLRVLQYEDDLREKDAQRNLPGWNFCTFFVLKEGLARAFESVGLLEDALIGYDELSVGLEDVIRESESRSSTSTVFHPYTKDLCEQFEKFSRSRKASEGNTSNNISYEQAGRDSENLPISSTNKDYRTLILSNNISVFDFNCYVFSRQKSLLLRQANLRSPARSSIPTTSAAIVPLASDLVEATRGNENMVPLAELCRRASKFTITATRMMREDIGKGLSKAAFEVKEAHLLVFVSAWAFSVLQQILEETQSSLLHSELLAEKTSSGQSLPKDNLTLPPRSSSLPRLNSYLAASNSVIYENARLMPDHGSSEDVAPVTTTALSEVAVSRAELLLLQRKCLTDLANIYGCAVQQRKSEDWEAGSIMASEATEAVVAALPTMRNLQLQKSLSSSQNFETAYQDLTHDAIRHYRLAGRTQSSNMLIADLASLKFEAADYAAAAGYFQSILDAFLQRRWNIITDLLIRKYASCLRQLHRKDEYARVQLTILAASVAQRRFEDTNWRRAIDNSNDWSENWARDSPQEREGEFSELVAFSRELPYELSVPMEQYFDTIVIHSQVRHFDDRDGFFLDVSFKPRVGDGARMDSLRVRLLNKPEQEPKEIWLESSGGFFIKPETVTVQVTSTISTLGMFEMDRIALQAGKLTFVCDYASVGAVDEPLSLSSGQPESSATNKQRQIQVYPRRKAVELNVTNSNYVRIGKPRSIAVQLHSGENQIERAKLQIRAATAGLRLRTANAEVFEEMIDIEDKSTAGVLTLGRLDASTMTIFSIPFDMERNANEISLRVDVNYTTKLGVFTYTRQLSVNVELAVDVNVQDIFLDKILLSKFFVRPIRGKTCWVIDTQLASSERYYASPVSSTTPFFLASSKQPVCITYKISPTNNSDSSSEEIPSGQRSLPLTVNYVHLEEDYVNQVSEKFANDLAESHISSFHRLLVPEFKRKIRKLVSSHQDEIVGLLECLEMPTFADMDWKDYLLNVYDPIQAIYYWLHQWHQDNKIFLPSKMEASSLRKSRSPRQLIIDFEIPVVGYLHTADLLLLNDNGDIMNYRTTIEIGKPLNVQVHIRHSRVWDTSTPAKSSSLEKLEGPKRFFTYELLTNPDVWLVGGHRRGTFLAAEQESIAFTKVLIPLRTGRHMLPLIDVKVAPTVQVQGENARCETDYTSQGQSIVVLEGCSSITMGFGQEGHIGNGIAVLESGVMRAL